MSQTPVAPRPQDAWHMRGWPLARALLVAPAQVLFPVGVFSHAVYGNKEWLRLDLRVSLILAGPTWLIGLTENYRVSQLH
ncbi:hypothetical protein [Deinococcus frigens]|uniref:hypothetical protein n=1 Tax=Deinococcus frigens TaxID=249403 RepID=UPI0012EB70F6|nr:hypothetical protein [Deinococcus frigens]